MSPHKDVYTHLYTHLHTHTVRLHEGVCFLLFTHIFWLVSERHTHFVLSDRTHAGRETEGVREECVRLSLSGRGSRTSDKQLLSQRTVDDDGTEEEEEGGNNNIRSSDQTWWLDLKERNLTNLSHEGNLRGDLRRTRAPPHTAQRGE